MSVATRCESISTSAMCRTSTADALRFAISATVAANKAPCASKSKSDSRPASR
jgi:hypothetical protein